MANWIMDDLSVDSYIRNAINGLLQQKEKILQDQLIELIKRDLIIIEQTEPVIIRAINADGKEEFKLQQSVRLVPKEFDYIKKLEAQVKELTEKLDKIKELL